MERGERNQDQRHERNREQWHEMRFVRSFVRCGFGLVRMGCHERSNKTDAVFGLLCFWDALAWLC